MSEPPGKAVHLSYASQDAEAARRIAQALRADQRAPAQHHHESAGTHAAEGAAHGAIGTKAAAF
jgi:hypothetical protein